MGFGSYSYIENMAEKGLFDKTASANQCLSKYPGEATPTSYAMPPLKLLERANKSRETETESNLQIFHSPSQPDDLRSHFLRRGTVRRKSTLSTAPEPLPQGASRPQLRSALPPFR